LLLDRENAGVFNGIDPARGDAAGTAAVEAAAARFALVLAWEGEGAGEAKRDE